MLAQEDRQNLSKQQLRMNWAFRTDGSQEVGGESWEEWLLQMNLNHKKREKERKEIP